MSPNNCSCNSGYKGVSCQEFDCSTLGNCNLGIGGSCTGPNICTCTSEWTSLNCSIRN